jgi:hypothetical protein
MAKFERKLSPEQERELFRAVVDLNGPRMSTRRALRKAQAGELGTVGPFSISYSRACELVAEERERVEGIGRKKETKSRPQDAIDNMARRLLVLEDREVSRIERAANGPRGKRDPARTAAVVRNLRAIRQLLNDGDPSRGNGKAPVSGSDDAKPGSVLDQAREAMEREASTSPSETPQEEEASTDTATPDEPSREEETHTDERDADAVSSLARSDLDVRRRAAAASSLAASRAGV